MILVGVYKITCKVNNRFYIGASINIENRWREHRRDANNQKHHSIIFQRAWNKYGEDAFSFDVMELCDEEQYLKREQYYLDLLKPYQKEIGFNVSPKAQNNVMYGEKHPLFGKGHTEETKQKMRGPKSIEAKKNMSENHADTNGSKNPMYGKKHRPESISLMSKKMVGRYKGEKSVRAIITQEIADKIKELYATGKYTQHGLAANFGISRGCVSNIIYGRSWAT